MSRQSITKGSPHDELSQSKPHEVEMSVSRGVHPQVPEESDLRGVAPVDLGEVLRRLAQQRESEVEEGHLLVDQGGRPVDLVDRRFVATRPNQLWVSDFTYVATWGGFVYVSTSCSQYLSMRYTDRLVDAGIVGSTGLVHHSDAGSQYLSIRTRIASWTPASRRRSAANDAYDNALAESVIGLYKTEVIRRKGPSRRSTRWRR